MREGKGEKKVGKAGKAGGAGKSAGKSAGELSEAGVLGLLERAFEESGDSEALEAVRDGRVVAGADDTFGVGIVYAYGGLGVYVGLYRAMFKDSPWRKDDGGEDEESPASAYCAFGPGPDEHPLALVWLNDRTPLEETVPSCMHEISHLADSIIGHAGVEDGNGELRAYIVGREARRVLRGLYGSRLRGSAGMEALRQAAEKGTAGERKKKEEG